MREVNFTMQIDAEKNKLINQGIPAKKRLFSGNSELLVNSKISAIIVESDENAISKIQLQALVEARFERYGIKTKDDDSPKIPILITVKVIGNQKNPNGDAFIRARAFTPCRIVGDLSIILVDATLWEKMSIATTGDKKDVEDAIIKVLDEFINLYLKENKK